MAGHSSFGVFLDTFERKTSKQRGEPKGVRLGLLRMVPEDQPRTVDELYKDSGMSFQEFSLALNNMLNSHLLELRTVDAGEAVEITSDGRRLLAGNGE